MTAHWLRREAQNRFGCFAAGSSEASVILEDVESCAEKNFGKADAGESEEKRRTLIIFSVRPDSGHRCNAVVGSAI